MSAGIPSRLPWVWLLKGAGVPVCEAPTDVPTLIEAAPTEGVSVDSLAALAGAPQEIPAPLWRKRRLQQGLQRKYRRFGKRHQVFQTPHWRNKKKKKKHGVNNDCS